MPIHFFLPLGFALMAQVAAKPPAFPHKGGPYLGQALPGETPTIFAPGLINTGLAVRDVAISPDGKEIYFGAEVGNFAVSTILVTRQVGGVWQEPVVLPHLEDPRYMNLEPCLSPDGKRLFFLSNRPAKPGEAPGNQDIWMMDRQGDTWGEPVSLGAPVCTEDSEFFPSLTRDGTLYFTRSPKNNPRASAIYRSRFKDGRYQPPEKLPAQVNSGTTQFNAFIAPDESYLIVPVAGRKDSLGGTDYYVVFRNPDDTWQEPVNLGPAINSAERPEWSPYVSPDGKAFFFMSSRLSPAWEKPGALRTWRDLHRMAATPGNGFSHICWVDAAVIHRLRKPATP